VGLICHRVVIIDKGSIIAEDTAAGLSERIQGATRIQLRIAGPRVDILSTLRALPNVREAHEQEAADNDADGHRFIVISLERTIAREIAQVVVNRGWALYELTPTILGLEELFVRLTATSDQRKEAA
jgi:gliding motility-associated transport system ATP-binding protein